MNGVKVVANFGGVVAAVIMLGSLFSLVKILKNYRSYDVTGANPEEMPSIEEQNIEKEL